MKKTMELTFMTIEDWIETQEDLPVDKIKIISCKDCNGSGHTECELCGHTDLCDECEGTGKVTDYGVIQFMYDIQLSRDLQNFERYKKAVGLL